jgi:hypothetical protein
LHLLPPWKLGAIRTRIERIEEAIDHEDSDASFLDAMMPGWWRIHYAPAAAVIVLAVHAVW